MMHFDYRRHIFRSPQFQSVVDEAIAFFLATPAYEVPPPVSFVGVGVYALYYLGDFELYAKLSRQNREQPDVPIYVGKAVPPRLAHGKNAE